ncbi:hypothetical protein ATE47_03995 [Chryseobacterium sp. IHB B 17019]|uniref:hypothetical protein n=1 Tax=Chryseobacterium sp. IHB B 17019 TaxID=1721091 RepID=UPI00071F2E17|nr:hypothetical protein [Chryseobacterium sp. IHB B 17019]ALR29732.1 hypothetical protein ATE47_03995 [Chryseobacterium sp. IHB B 17019]
MENVTLQLNDKINAYMRLTEEEKKRKGMYKSFYFRMFDYPDGTSSIVLDKTGEINIGDDFRDHKGKLHIVTEVVNYRPHKGVFDDEEKRQKVAIVKSEIIPNL